MALSQEQINSIPDESVRNEVQRMNEQAQKEGQTAEAQAEKSVEERRGADSPTGKYRLGSTIDVPLYPTPAAVSKADVIQRQKDLANEIMGMLGDDADPEAAAFRDRLVSGNVDELELANMKMHLSDEGHKKAREKIRAETKARAEQRAKADEERQKAQEEKQKEAGTAEGQVQPQQQAYTGNEPR